MRTLLYDLLKRGVSLCFNTLNVLLGGNLPPFGSAAVIVEEQDCYLVVELPRGRVVFPGGFMTWREDPKHTAQREAQEETGLLVRVDHLIGTYFSASDSFLNMSTVSCVYAAEMIGGVLRNGVEGRACWLHEEELRKRLSPHSRGILDDYLRSRPLPLASLHPTSGRTDRLALALRAPGSRRPGRASTTTRASRPQAAIAAAVGHVAAHHGHLL
jgi:ADP-ribose pyrophosphatase YjhB (NUDIX family)